MANKEKKLKTLAVLSVGEEHPLYQNDVENYENGYQYVQAQIASGRWDLESDTFDIETALADAWEEGRLSVDAE